MAICGSNLLRKCTGSVGIKDALLFCNHIKILVVIIFCVHVINFTALLFLYPYVVLGNR